MSAHEPRLRMEFSLGQEVEVKMKPGCVLLLCKEQRIWRGVILSDKFGAMSEP